MSLEELEVKEHATLDLRGKRLLIFIVAYNAESTIR